MSPYKSVVIPAIDYEQCQACPVCEAAKHCRFRALVRIDRDEPPFIDVGHCNGCGDCAPHCPYQAIQPNNRIGAEPACTEDPGPGS
jgi:MinD superfamily P-loop ATPase